MTSAFATVETTGLEKKLLEFALVMERNGREVLHQQGRLAAGDMAKFTPPTGKAPVSESFNAQKKAGENAVKNDINRAFFQIQEIKLKDNKARETILKYAAREDYEKLTTVLRRMKFKNEVVASPTEALHNQKRGSGGRVRDGAKQALVVRRGTVKDFIKKKQRLVGLAKSGTRRAASALGSVLPNWVTRHSGSGIFVDQSNRASNPFLIIGNTVTYIQSAAARLRIVQRVIDRRKQSMQNQMDAALKRSFKGYK